MGKPKIRPHRIKTPDPIDKFGTVDYVGEGTPRAKCQVNLPPRAGASRQIGEIYAKKIY